MTTIVTVQIPADGFLLGRLLASGDDYRAEVSQFVRAGERFALYVRIHADDHDRVESAFRDHAAVDDVTRYDERTGRALYELWVRSDSDFLAILDDVDLVVATGQGSPSGWEFELLANDRDELTAFQSACDAHDVPIDVRRFRRSDQVSGDGSAITAKQRELLRIAHERGYFRVPREVTVTELAAEMDVSPQATSRLLRRGLENAISEVVTED